MHKSDMTIATITLARGPEESVFLCRSMESLAGSGMPVLVADGGSAPEFLDCLDRLANVTLVQPAGPSQAGVWSQARQVLMAARRLGSPYLFYTECDKQWFFENRLEDFLTSTARAGSAGVYVAARTAESFTTFPDIQRYVETVVNQLCSETIGRQGDYTYGPMLIDSTLLPYLDLIREDVGWGWRIVLLAVARRLGRAVVPITMDLPCPIEQRSETGERARIHRLQQLAQNVRGLILGSQVSLDPNGIS